MNNNKPKSCPVCKSKNVPFLMKKGKCKLFKCKKCDHIFVYPVISEDEIVDIYSSANYDPTKKYKLFSKKYKFHKNFISYIKILKKYKPFGKILDVGCNDGEFLFLAKLNNYSIRGVEINPKTAESAKKE